MGAWRRDVAGFPQRHLAGTPQGNAQSGTAEAHGTSAHLDAPQPDTTHLGKPFGRAITHEARGYSHGYRDA